MGRFGEHLDAFRGNFVTFGGRVLHEIASFPAAVLQLYHEEILGWGGGGARIISEHFWHQKQRFSNAEFLLIV